MMIKVSTKAEILLNADLKGLIRERDEYFQAKNTMHNKSLRREGPKMNPTSLFIGIMRITCLRNRMATVIRSNSSRKLLSSLNPYEAVGPDGLHPRVPKELSSAIAPANNLLFSILWASLQFAAVPWDLEAGLCDTYNYKKESKQLPVNYKLQASFPNTHLQQDYGTTDIESNPYRHGFLRSLR